MNPDEITTALNQGESKLAARLEAAERLDWLDSPEATEALSFLSFNTGPIAHLFRAAGHDIPRKIEAEQAFVLRWMLKLVHQHKAAWKSEGEKILGPMRKPIDAAIKEEGK